MPLSGGTHTRCYNADQATVKAAVDEALEGLRFRVISRQDGHIEATTGLSLFSTGTTLAIDVAEGEEPGQTVVAIAARPKMKTVLIDYGQSNRDANKIFRAVDATLGVEAATEETTDAEPEGDAEASQGPVCASCGADLEAGSRFCQKCGAKVAAADGSEMS